MDTIKESLTDLTWDDLRQWTGAKILNRGKKYIKNVYDLARTEDGGLVAMVSGSEEYATWVDSDEDGELDWFCSCPYNWGPCKHAVALILAGLEQVETGRKIPLVDTEGELFLAIWRDSDEGDDFWDDDDFDDEESEFDEVVKPEKGRKNQALIKILQEKNKEELIGLLVEFAARHPEVKRKILEDDQLKRGKTDKLASALLEEIKDITSEPAWYNPWKGEGNLPDYSHVQEQLAALLQKGHADVVVELGLELWERGNAQVEQSHDEGDTAVEIQECMEIIFKAVTLSSLSRSEQLLWMVDIFLEDQFSISDSCERFTWNKAYKKEHWSEVARKLQERLQTMPAPKADSFSSRYHRERVMNWLIDAFDRSDQQEKVLPLLEKEAQATQCYKQLVDIFLQNGDTEKAREWCINGFKKTIKTAPGIAHSLQKKLRELARQEKKFDLAAAYRAQDFFDHPSCANYIELKKAAEKIECWRDIRASVLRFLENGQRPDLPSKGRKKHSWPLPSPEVAQERDKRFRQLYPDHDTLIDIAIFENRLDDVVELYHSQQKTSRWGHGKGREVAKAVAESHPDISLNIWKKIAEDQINMVKPKAYEEAAIYLRKMHEVYKETNRLEEWHELIRTIRTEHKAKRRLLEVLDSLENKRIISS